MFLKENFPVYIVVLIVFTLQCCKKNQKDNTPKIWSLEINKILEPVIKHKEILKYMFLLFQ
jgi:hypothetical protein